MTPSTHPLDIIGDAISSLLIILFNAVENHPRIAAALAIIFGGCYLGTQVVRGVYPAESWRPSDRPAWARVTLAVCSPISGVLTGVLARLASRPSAR